MLPCLYSPMPAKIRDLFFTGALLFLLAPASHAEVKVATGTSATGSGFTFQSVPAPANNDAATTAQFTLVDGTRDMNGGDLAVLHDGRVPTNEDQPSENFFFRADGGRIRVDLGRVIFVKQVGSYSWHRGTRAPQVYKLYAADGTAAGFQLGPMKGTDPATCGWKFIASVDSRPKAGDGAGQHGVAITDTTGVIGKFRHLLFDIARTEERDPFGNTFFSEIDVMDANGPAPTAIAAVKPILKSFDAESGKFRFIIDATAAPDLADWCEKDLKPVVQNWYPKIVAMLPSDGYQAPTDITLKFRSDMGGTPASAAGAGVNLNTQWFRGELQRQAAGAVIHELVHVVQNYRGPRGNPNATATPGWIVEGIADYVRWFLYEPQSKGAEITKGNLAKASYDSSYRITGNFLNWLTQTHDKEIVRKLNAAAREGKYGGPLWKDWTGKSVQELGEEWKKSHEQRLNAAPSTGDLKRR